MTAAPRLKRRSVRAKAGIVHLGPGAFFRAFNAIYTDDLLRDQGGDWGIVAVSMQSDRARRELHAQGGAYTSITLEPQREERRIIEAITDVMVLPDDPKAVVAVMANPQIKVVTMTITEKGYCLAPASGALRLDAPEIQEDLATPDMPRTMPGLVVEALAQRRAADIEPFTVLSCDNLPSNGETTRQVILDFARARSPDLADWIEHRCRFPSSMVDRITPATTDDVIETLRRAEGYTDFGCVQHEPFRQWVIEDDFVDGVRPDWSAAGAQFVRSVKEHEAMKLRCLNGTHSTLAYLGYLAGFETIADTVAHPEFAQLCRRMWQEEILPTIAPPEGEDLAAYVDALLRRYQNPAIRHRTWQIAMDGSQKLPQRLLGTIADNLSQGHVPRLLCLAVAGWMRYVRGQDERGNPIDVRDPMAYELLRAHAGASASEEAVAALLALSDVFPPDLAQNTVFRTAVTSAYLELEANGSLATVARAVEN